ncbi:hypothetical protein C8Q74DRAFT_1366419 [Fomes fomentarius]|nr:hypothetical protein C8Q74DRAFT_1366419 [Fomes fomentarius]
MLEEQIARLEARIREIEHPELVVPSITLNPAQANIQSQTSATQFGSPSTPIVGNLVSDAGPLIMPGNHGQQISLSPALSQDPSIEPPNDLVRTLINAFLPHSSSLGFFLHVPRVMQAIQLPQGDPRRAQLSTALLNAIYLWGAHLSTSNGIRSYEGTFLTRATNALSTALRDSHYTVVNLIQAEVLVANYFFTMSRFLEGRYHCSAAVALTLSCRLSKIRSSADQRHGHGLQGRDFNLPPARDAIEEGERIRGFWFIYALDKSWAVALGSPSHFNGVAQSGSHVDTPWPLEMSQYEAGGMSADFRSALTVLTFVSGGASVPYGGRETQLSLRAKAATLFERATHLASQWSAMNLNRNEFYGRFTALDGLIDRFIASLPPVERSGNPDAILTSLVTHTMARAATIQLRSNFRGQDRMNDRKDLAAAQAVAGLLDNLNLVPTNVDPILAILWTAVSRVLIGEIIRSGPVQAPSSSQPLSSFASSSSAIPSYSSSSLTSPLHSHRSRMQMPSGSVPATASAGPSMSQRDAIRAVLDKVLGAMNRFRDTSQLMGTIHDGLVSLLGGVVTDESG